MALNFPVNPTNGDTFTDENTTWQFNGVAWDVIGSVNNLVLPNVFSNIVVAGQNTITADSTNDTLTIVAGSNITITTDASSDSLTIASAGDGEGGGDPNQNAFSNIAVSGQNTIAADTITDTLNVAAGTGIQVTTNSETDTITIASTVSSGVSLLNELTDVSNAGIDIHDIYEHAIVTLRVGNVGTTAYTFDSHYSGNNPGLYVLSGTTVAFDLDNIAGHPFELQDNTLTPLTSNLVHVANDGTVSTDSAAQGKNSGMLYWRIPENITNNTNYVYQCQTHASMFGTITIKRLANI